MWQVNVVSNLVKAASPQTFDTFDQAENYAEYLDCAFGSKVTANISLTEDASEEQQVEYKSLHSQYIKNENYYLDLIKTKKVQISQIEIEIENLEAELVLGC